MTRRATDLVVVAMLYAIVLAGSYAYVYTSTRNGSSCEAEAAPGSSTVR